MKNGKKIWGILASLLILVGSLTVPTFAQYGPSSASYVAGERVAMNYAYGFGNVPGANVIQGNTATGSTSVTVCPAVRALGDGRVIALFNTNSPVFFDFGTTTSDTVTPTSVSLIQPPIGQQGDQQCAVISGTFNNTHGASQMSSQVRSGTYGLQEAIDDAAPVGGVVAVGADWLGTNTILAAATVYPNVILRDKRFGVEQTWKAAPGSTTVLGTPTAPTAQAACDATHQFCSDANVAGSASWGGAVHLAISCVDIMGNESISSTDVTFTSVASKAIDIGNPAAVTGCVGWKPYLSLSGGTYALAYSVPLLTQPTVLQAIPLSANVCQLTTVEQVTPACRITNTTYGQVASNTGANGTFLGGAQFTGYPVVTSMLAPNLDSASAQSLNPSNGGMQAYKYAPGTSSGIPGVLTAYNSFPITTAAQSTVGQVAGTIKLPVGFMNYPGRTVEICGMLSKTSTTADTITNIQLWWDSEGSNVTAGTAVELSNIQITQTLTAAATLPFCQDVTTTISAATATGGTLLPGMGWLTESQVAAGTIHTASSNILLAAVGSLNLALNANIEVVYNHTTGTDGAGVVLLNPTVKILN